MKRQTMILLGCAITLIVCSAWTSGVPAVVRNSTGPSTSVTPRVDFPLHTICTVTVDSRSTEKPVLAGTANKVKGL